MQMPACGLSQERSLGVVPGTPGLLYFVPYGIPRILQCGFANRSFPTRPWSERADYHLEYVLVNLSARLAKVVRPACLLLLTFLPTALCPGAFLNMNRQLL
ncbi:hypothetical protein CPAR01_01149 [Colletotrichum paranaense]|uniref:Uncharacterized protein n=1 Tax=Colletotrichum paranaense TaxID=1914294 RepID=A0ABQ9T5W3_9PEZI|nr:uncharacterized protein CPAR01_01149 [Colletotrichum paranaense]KAK1547182.1 hypothetical protein CPAR01_01149 [Colletotrichum paranaense]